MEKANNKCQVGWQGFDPSTTIECEVVEDFEGSPVKVQWAKGAVMPVVWSHSEERVVFVK